MKTGEKIRQVRINRGLTQKQLGELCGIAEPNIRKYELGTQNPKVETVKKIADALGIDPFVLLTLESHPEERYKKWLDIADPIYKYLHSIGYTLEQGEPEEQPIGNIKILKNKSDIILVDKDGNQSIFTKEDFEGFKRKVEESVNYLFWQQNQRK